MYVIYYFNIYFVQKNKNKILTTVGKFKGFTELTSNKKEKQ